MATKRILTDEVMRKWIEALRSGEYKQGFGTLKMSTDDDPDNKSEHQFCCLGVLCDVLEVPNKPIKEDTDEYWFLFDFTKYEVSYENFDNLPITISDELLNHYNIDTHKLVSMNDEDSSTFRDIADYIVIASKLR